jgi:hypothetical protein
MACEAALNRLDQAQMDLRHARAALDAAQNPSDREFAAAAADRLIKRVAALRVEARRR